MRSLTAVVTTHAARLCFKRACIITAAVAVVHTLGGHAVGTVVFKIVEAVVF